MDNGDILLRMDVGLPAVGRTINAGEAVKIFFEQIPACVKKSLYYNALDAGRLEKISELADNQAHIRQKLSELGLWRLCRRWFGFAERVGHFPEANEKCGAF